MTNEAGAPEPVGRVIRAADTVIGTCWRGSQPGAYARRVNMGTTGGRAWACFAPEARPP
jgi:hypothetical protein